MQGLRTVTVLEHEVIPVAREGETMRDGYSSAAAIPWLSDVDGQALLRLNDFRRGFCQKVSGGVKLAQYCGIVRLQSCVLEVLPKVGMTDVRAAGELERSRTGLLTMLHSARLPSITKIGSVPQQAVSAPLLDIFIDAFLRCALEQARRGLLCRYVSRKDDLAKMRGRFHIHGHLRYNVGRPHLLHCEYDEFTADNPYNRAVRATLDACRTWVSRAATQRLWFETHARFASISSTRASAADVAQLPRERTTRRYEPLLTWCEWLLGMNSPAMSAGTTQAPGLLFDMNKLFEAYVCGLEEVAAGERYIVYRQGPVEALATHGDTDALLLKPDVTVWHTLPDGSAARIARVLDSKWKRLDPDAAHWGVDQADVYQMLAYAVRYRCQQLELVYPVPGKSAPSGEPPTFQIAGIDPDRSAIQIRVKTVPLWQV